MASDIDHIKKLTISDSSYPSNSPNFKSTHIPSDIQISSKASTTKSSATLTSNNASSEDDVMLKYKSIDNRLRNKEIIERNLSILAIYKKDKSDILELMDKHLSFLRQDIPKCKSVKRLIRSIVLAMLTYREYMLKFDLCDQYVDKIQKFLAIYFELELKSFNRLRDICADKANQIVTNIKFHLKVLSCSSPLDIIIQMVNFDNGPIYLPLLRLVFEALLNPLKSKIPVNLNDENFIKHLIVFKMWRKLETEPNKREEVDKLYKTTIEPLNTLCFNERFAPYLPKYSTDKSLDHFKLLCIPYSWIVLRDIILKEKQQNCYANTIIALDLTLDEDDEIPNIKVEPEPIRLLSLPDEIICIDDDDDEENDDENHHLPETFYLSSLLQVVREYNIGNNIIAMHRTAAVSEVINLDDDENEEEVNNVAATSEASDSMLLPIDAEISSNVIVIQATCNNISSFVADDLEKNSDGVSGSDQIYSPIVEQTFLSLLPSTTDNNTSEKQTSDLPHKFDLNTNAVMETDTSMEDTSVSCVPILNCSQNIQSTKTIVTADVDPVVNNLVSTSDVNIINCDASLSKRRVSVDSNDCNNFSPLPLNSTIKTYERKKREQTKIPEIPITLPSTQKETHNIDLAASEDDDDEDITDYSFFFCSDKLKNQSLVDKANSGNFAWSSKKMSTNVLTDNENSTKIIAANQRNVIFSTTKPKDSVKTNILNEWPSSEKIQLLVGDQTVQQKSLSDNVAKTTLPCSLPLSSFKNKLITNYPFDDMTEEMDINTPIRRNRSKSVHIKFKEETDERIKPAKKTALPSRRKSVSFQNTDSIYDTSDIPLQVDAIIPQATTPPTIQQRISYIPHDGNSHKLSPDKNAMQQIVTPLPSYINTPPRLSSPQLLSDADYVLLEDNASKGFHCPILGYYRTPYDQTRSPQMDNGYKIYMQNQIKRPKTLFQHRNLSQIIFNGITYPRRYVYLDNVIVDLNDIDGKLFKAIVQLSDISLEKNKHARRLLGAQRTSNFDRYLERKNKMKQLQSFKSLTDVESSTKNLSFDSDSYNYKRIQSRRKYARRRPRKTIEISSDTEPENWQSPSNISTNTIYHTKSSTASYEKPSTSKNQSKSERVYNQFDDPKLKKIPIVSLEQCNINSNIFNGNISSSSPVKKVAEKGKKFNMKSKVELLDYRILCPKQLNVSLTKINIEQYLSNIESLIENRSKPQMLDINSTTDISLIQNNKNQKINTNSSYNSFDVFSTIPTSNKSKIPSVRKTQRKNLKKLVVQSEIRTSSNIYLRNHLHDNVSPSSDDIPLSSYAELKTNKSLKKFTKITHLTETKDKSEQFHEKLLENEKNKSHFSVALVKVRRNQDDILVREDSTKISPSNHSKLLSTILPLPEIPKFNSKNEKNIATGNKKSSIRLDMLCLKNADYKTLENIPYKPKKCKSDLELEPKKNDYLFYKSAKQHARRRSSEIFAKMHTISIQKSSLQEIIQCGPKEWLEKADLSFELTKKILENTEFMSITDNSNNITDNSNNIPDVASLPIAHIEQTGIVIEQNQAISNTIGMSTLDQTETVHCQETINSITDESVKFTSESSEASKGSSAVNRSNITDEVKSTKKQCNSPCKSSVVVQNARKNTYDSVDYYTDEETARIDKEVEQITSKTSEYNSYTKNYTVLQRLSIEICNEIINADISGKNQNISPTSSTKRKISNKEDNSKYRITLVPQSRLLKSIDNTKSPSKSPDNYLPIIGQIDKSLEIKRSIIKSQKPNDEINQLFKIGEASTSYRSQKTVKFSTDHQIISPSPSSMSASSITISSTIDEPYSPSNSENDSDNENSQDWPYLINSSPSKTLNKSVDNIKSNIQKIFGDDFTQHSKKQYQLGELYEEEEQINSNEQPPVDNFDSENDIESPEYEKYISDIEIKTSKRKNPRRKRRWTKIRNRKYTKKMKYLDSDEKVTSSQEVGLAANDVIINNIPINDDENQLTDCGNEEAISSTITCSNSPQQNIQTNQSGEADLVVVVAPSISEVLANVSKHITKKRKSMVAESNFSEETSDDIPLITLRHQTLGEKCRSSQNETMNLQNTSKRRKQHVASPADLTILSLKANVSKTYSKDGVVANVFVPPDVEKIIEEEQQPSNSREVASNPIAFIDSLENSLTVQHEEIAL